MRLRSTHWAVYSLVTIVGCSNAPSRLVPPAIDGDAGTAAVKQYDTNGDGVLNAAELEKSPALKSAVERIDKNGDRQLTADEIDQRIEQWRKSGVALTTVDAAVRLNGRPLAGAQVTLVPEKFLGDEIEPARGVVDELGMARIVISNEPDTAGVRVGWYRIEISKIDQGAETVPARYNQQSELGVEVASDVYTTRNLVLNLVGR